MLRLRCDLATGRRRRAVLLERPLVCLCLRPVRSNFPRSRARGKRPLAGRDGGNANRRRAKQLGAREKL